MDCRTTKSLYVSVFASCFDTSHIMTRLMKVSCKRIIKTKSLQKQDSRARQLEK